MNGLENESGATPSAIEGLQAEIKTLRMLMAVALLMLIGLSICADYYLSRQTEGVNLESNQLQMAADSFPQAAAGDFVKRLKDYSKTHPDFAPLAKKYAGLFGAQTAPAPKK